MGESANHNPCCRRCNPNQNSTTSRRKCSKIETPVWIQQHVIRSRTEFGVDYKGCEDKAKELFRKTENNKQEIKGKHGEQEIVKKKGMNELKGLELNTKFMRNGTRSRGIFGYKRLS